MAHTESPSNVGQLWLLIQRELNDVKSRLDSYVTKDQFDAERRLLEARIATAESQLAELQRVVREERSTRQHSRREFVYKGIIPSLALIVAVVSVVLASR